MLTMERQADEMPFGVADFQRGHTGCVAERVNGNASVFNYLLLAGGDAVVVQENLDCVFSMLLSILDGNKSPSPCNC